MAAEGSYTVAEWQALVAPFDRCPMCLRVWSEILAHGGGGCVITVDHIVAISGGGSNRIENIQPSDTPATRRRAIGRIGAAESDVS